MAKKEVKGKTAPAKAEEAPKKTTVGATAIAERLGVEPATLRRWLRAQGKNTEGEYKRYEFSEAGADKIVKDYTKYQEELAAKKEAAKEEKPKASKKAKKASKKAKDDDDEEVTNDEEEEEEID